MTLKGVFSARGFPSKRVCSSKRKKKKVEWREGKKNFFSFLLKRNIFIYLHIAEIYIHTICILTYTIYIYIWVALLLAHNVHRPSHIYLWTKHSPIIVGLLSFCTNPPTLRLYMRARLPCQWLIYTDTHTTHVYIKNA